MRPLRLCASAIILSHSGWFLAEAQRRKVGFDYRSAIRQKNVGQKNMESDMKILIGVLLVASFICADAVAQEKNDQQQSNQTAAGAGRTFLDMMMMSQSQKSLPANNDKTDAELADKRRKFEFRFSIVVIEGAVYTTIGDKLIPWPGGGASGCFDPTGAETAARIERANAAWAKQSKKD
jgi:hypothetical protein